MEILVRRSANSFSLIGKTFLNQLRAREWAAWRGIIAEPCYIRKGRPLWPHRISSEPCYGNASMSSSSPRRSGSVNDGDHVVERQHVESLRTMDDCQPPIANFDRPSWALRVGGGLNRLPQIELELYDNPHRDRFSFKCPRLEAPLRGALLRLFVEAKALIERADNRNVRYRAVW